MGDFQQNQVRARPLAQSGSGSHRNTKSPGPACPDIAVENIEKITPQTPPFTKSMNITPTTKRRLKSKSPRLMCHTLETEGNTETFPRTPLYATSLSGSPLACTRRRRNAKSPDATCNQVVMEDFTESYPSKKVFANHLNTTPTTCTKRRLSTKSPGFVSRGMATDDIEESAPRKRLFAKSPDSRGDLGILQCATPSYVPRKRLFAKSPDSRGDLGILHSTTPSSKQCVVQAPPDVAQSQFRSHEHNELVVEEQSSLVLSILETPEWRNMCRKRGLPPSQVFASKSRKQLAQQLLATNSVSSEYPQN